jgi:hypothetical protein
MPLFTVDLGHFFFVGREPKSAALVVFDIRRQIANELLPQCARIRSQSELCFGIIHDHDVAHAGRSGSTRDGATIQHEHFESGPGAFGRTRGPHDASAHDDDVKGLTHNFGDA